MHVESVRAHFNSQHRLPVFATCIGHVMIDDDVHDSRLIGSAGSTFVIWFGPTPRLAVADPDLIQEIFVSRSDRFDRYEAHPMVRQLEGDGLTNLHGPKWALHRRVLSPAFRPDNLKVIIIN